MAVGALKVRALTADIPPAVVEDTPAQAGVRSFPPSTGRLPPAKHETEQAAPNRIISYEKQYASVFTFIFVWGH